MSKTILALGSLLPAEMETLERHFKVVRMGRKSDPEAILREYGHEVSGLISSVGSPVTRKLMEALPNLEIICRYGIGVDNIDLAAAAERAVAVTNTPGLVTNDTADVAMALLLGCARRTMEGDMYVRVGKWLNGPMGLGVTLSGKTVGIVGLGRIGQAVARRALAFDMQVAYYGRREKPEFPYSYVPDLIKLAEQSDFMIITVAGGEPTRHLIDGAVLRALGPQGFLVNVSRGTVVDEAALVKALEDKTIAGAGLDVFENEPHVPEALMKMDNVVLLPHIGTATQETRSRMGQLVIENLLAHFSGQPLKTPVAA